MVKRHHLYQHHFETFSKQGLTLKKQLKKHYQLLIYQLSMFVVQNHQDEYYQYNRQVVSSKTKTVSGIKSLSKPAAERNC